MRRSVLHATASVLLLVGAAYGAAAARAETSAPSGSAPSETEKKKILYELGVQMSGAIQTFELSEEEFKVVTAGLADGYRHKADPQLASGYEPRMQALRNARIAAMAQREKDAGNTYRRKAARASGSVVRVSGLVYRPLVEGTGPRPGAHDAVQINYVARLINGTVFDSSVRQGAPATLALDLVMPCFTEALQLMKVGGKSRIVCPAELAYGDRGSLPDVLPGATLEFDVELLAINPTGAPVSSVLSDHRPDLD